MKEQHEDVAYRLLVNQSKPFINYSRQSLNHWSCMNVLNMTPREGVCVCVCVCMCVCVCVCVGEAAQHELGIMTSGLKWMLIICKH